jgi:hypothetical protein
VKPLEDLSNRFLVLNNKGGESQLNLEGQLFVFLSSVLPRKIGLSGFAQIKHPSISYFLYSGLEDKLYCVRNS